MKHLQRVVILGASGFIGYQLGNFLSKNKSFSLILIDNFIRGKRDKYFNDLIQKHNVVFYNLDLSRLESYDNLFSKGDIVINCAALNGTSNFYDSPVDVIHNSAISAIIAAEAAAKSRVRTYIYFGSSESYSAAYEHGLTKIPSSEDVPLIIPNPKNPRWSYGASKTIGEISAIANFIQFDSNYIILRIHNIYGPRMGDKHVIPDLIKKFLRGDGGVFGLDESRSFMYIDDLLFIMNSIINDISAFSNDIYHIGSTRETSILDLAKEIQRLLGKNFELYSCGKFEGSVQRRCPDTRLIKSRVNFAETDLLVGLDKTINWYLNEQ